MPTARLTIPTSAAVFSAALEGLTRTNQALMRLGGVPPLYSAGVTYRTEPREIWRHARDVARERWGDCEDLAAYRAAELRETGEDPAARVDVYQSGPRRFHAVVKRGDGKQEDPSRVLGMGSSMGYDDFEDAEIGADPTPAVREVTWTVERAGQGWRGIVRVPLDLGRAMTVRGPEAKAPKAAAASAISMASKALDSPVAQALLPPGAKLALNLMKSDTAKAIGKKLLNLF